VTEKHSKISRRLKNVAIDMYKMETMLEEEEEEDKRDKPNLVTEFSFCSFL
jgi:hypothetical protein